MTTGALAATLCSPMCKLAKYLRTTVEDLDAFFPTEASTSHAAIAIVAFCGLTIPLLLTPFKKSQDGNDDTNEGITEEEQHYIDKRKGPIAALSAVLFASGLFVSGMTKSLKIYGFLDMKLVSMGKWDPTLICVMGGGLCISALSYQFVTGHNNFLKVSCAFIFYPFL